MFIKGDKTWLILFHTYLVITAVIHNYPPNDPRTNLSCDILLEYNTHIFLWLAASTVIFKKNFCLCVFFIWHLKQRK